MLERVIQETDENPQQAIIWLHGLGADGNDFVPVIPLLGLRRPTRLIFPHAPIQPVTVNGGMAMRAWYDIYEMTLERKIDQAGIEASAAEVIELIEEQRAQGIALDQIFLVGFSQGGAVALHVLARFPNQLAGVLALSTYSPDLDQALTHNGSVETPLAIHHGVQDAVVPESLGQRTRDRFDQLGFAPSYRTWPMAHSVLPEQLTEIGQWIHQQTGS